MAKIKDEKPKKINIKDIAKIANVSPSTVSRALRNDREASKRTINKIKKIAIKLKYYPDELAKSLRSDKSNTIGIIFNDINNPFYSEVLWSIYKKLNELNYSMIVTYSNWDLDLERKNIINLLSKRVDGIIIFPILSLNDRKVINMDLLVENNIETVFVDNCPNQENICYSGSDHHKAIYIGTKYLIENGHKEILFYSGMPISYTEPYKQGYFKALAENNIQIKKNLIIIIEDLEFKNNCNTFKKLIKENNFKNKPTFSGVITIGDFYAISIYKAANELGLSIPDDFSIVSYDNIEVASALYPPLTTVHQSRKEIGENAVRILLHNIHNKENRIIEKSILRPHLVIRKSVKRLFDS